MIRSLQRLYDIPRLTLHDGDLTSKHALLEIRIHLEDPAKRQLRLAPPLGGRQQWEEVVSCLLGKRSANEVDREE